MKSSEPGWKGLRQEGPLSVPKEVAKGRSEHQGSGLGALHPGELGLGALHSGQVIGPAASCPVLRVPPYW